MPPLEYEEKITDIYQLFLIISDSGDNKFSDCVFAGNVHYLEDCHDSSGDGKGRDVYLRVGL